MRRSGYTLVELLVVMSVNSVLMAAAAVLLGMLLRSEHHGRRHFEETNAMTRLAEQLRADIAAANGASIAAVTPDDNPAGTAAPVDHLNMEGDGRRVEYWRDGERVRRVEHEQQRLLSREAYTLAGLSKVDFVLSADQFVSVSLELREGNGSEVWTIESQLGKEQRLSMKEKP